MGSFGPASLIRSISAPLIPGLGTYVLTPFFHLSLMTHPKPKKDPFEDGNNHQPSYLANHDDGDDDDSPSLVDGKMKDGFARCFSKQARVRTPDLLHLYVRPVQFNLSAVVQWRDNIHLEAHSYLSRGIFRFPNLR